MKTSFKVLKAGNGDSLLIRFLGEDGNFKNIIIDGGNRKSEYERYLKSEILDTYQNNECIDLMVITHTDQDHVKGIQYLLKDSDINKDMIKSIWFNSFDRAQIVDNNDISFIESSKVRDMFADADIKRDSNIVVEEHKVVDFFGAKITILSPLQEDVDKLIIKNSEDISAVGCDYSYSILELIDQNSKIFKDEIEELDNTIENRVSIAMLLEFKDLSLLLLGDANPDVIEDSIRKILIARGDDRLNVDFAKLSHHGSHRSLSLSLTSLIQCNNFIISTNGKKSNLPNKLTLAKLLTKLYRSKEAVQFIFNYEDVVEALNFKEEELTQYNFKCLKPNYDNGYVINL